MRYFAFMPLFILIPLLALILSHSEAAEVLPREKSVVVGERDARQGIYPEDAYQRTVMIGKCNGALVGPTLVITTWDCLYEEGVLRASADDQFVISKEGQAALRIRYKYRSKDWKILDAEEKYQPKILRIFRLPNPQFKAADVGGTDSVTESRLETAMKWSNLRNNFVVLEINTKLGDFLGYFRVAPKFDMSLDSKRHLRIAYYRQEPEIQLMRNVDECKTEYVGANGLFYHDCDIDRGNTKGAPIWIDDGTKDPLLVGIHLMETTRTLPNPKKTPELAKDKNRALELAVLWEHSMALDELEPLTRIASVALASDFFSATVNYARKTLADEAAAKEKK
jgi:hypothetical protein